VKKDINTDEFMKLASIFYTIEALSSTIVPVFHDIFKIMQNKCHFKKGRISRQRKKRRFGFV